VFFLKSVQIGSCSILNVDKMDDGNAPHLLSKTLHFCISRFSNNTEKKALVAEKAIA